MGKILVVDDDAMNLRMAEFILTKKGYEVVKATGASEALEVLAGTAFDLILLDIEMPQVDGFEAYGQIREQGVTTPIMFLSASTEDEVIQKAMDMGAADYIKKPFVADVIYEQVGKVL